MNILAFDTCFGAISVAVRRCADGRPSPPQVFEILEPPGAAQAERLLPMIQAAMTSANLTFEGLDVLAVTVGPGTFSGVRIGVAAARGLALAAGVRLAGATSLAVIAHRALDELGAELAERTLAVCMGAGRDHIYLQAFDGHGAGVVEPMVLSQRPSIEPFMQRPLVAVGTGAVRFAEWMRAHNLTVEVRRPDMLPRASDLAAMAECLPVGPIRPLYLRAPRVTPPADKLSTEG